MELRHLRYFIAVAEELHFSRAAAREHLSQPAISQQIRHLEADLGVQLLHRTKRSVQLTEAGQVFLVEARRTLQQAEQAVQRTQQASRGEWGRLNVGFTGSALYSVLPRIVQTFRERFPGVELSLSELCTPQQVEALLDGQLQLGFLHPPIEAAALCLEPVLREEIVVVLPEAHPLGARAQLCLQDLADQPFILFPRSIGPNLYDRIIKLCQQAGFHPNVVQEALQQTAISLASAGVGVALVATSLQKVGRPGVIYRQLKGPAPDLPLAVAFRRETVSPVIQAFLKVVGELVPQGPPDQADCLAPIEQ